MPAPVPNFAHTAAFIEGVDGDSFWLSLDLGVNTHGIRFVLPTYVRLYGIDCWELKQPKGPAARGFTIAALSVAKRITVQTIKPDGNQVGLEKYGRFLARVWADDDELADLLRAAGFEKTPT